MTVGGGDVYTHGHHDAVLRSHRWRTVANSAGYLEAHLVPGARLLDVGCGPGTLTADLAARVAPATVVAVDVEPSVLEAARAEAAAQRLSNVTFEAGDFRLLPLRPASFDVVHAHQVLQHLRDPVDALRAMAALVSPRGVVAARDGDYSAMTWSPHDDGLDRWRALYLAVARRNGGEPDAGRHLLRWAYEAGIDDVRYSSSTWTFAVPEERAWWSDLWADRVTESALAHQAVDYGLATPADLAEIAAAWRGWASHRDAVFVVVHGEIIGRPSG